jgi:hypothetical protein
MLPRYALVTREAFEGTLDQSSRAMAGKDAFDAANDTKSGGRKRRKSKRLWLAWNTGRLMECRLHAHPMGHEISIQGYVHLSEVFPTRGDALFDAEKRLRALLAEGWTDLTAKRTKNYSEVSRVSFTDVPRRIFLDSSTLQTLHAYGGFLYEGESLSIEDRIHRDPRGLAKLEALRLIMQIDQRAAFEFALSEHSFEEVDRKADHDYLQWAFDVLDHWLSCLEAAGDVNPNTKAVAAIESNAMNYLGAGDRALLRDAILLECDAFLTMENKLPKAAPHVYQTTGIRVFSPLELWDILRPWAALFY